MDTSLSEKIGMALDTYTFKIELGKIREFALALGQLNEEYLNGEKILPTFPTVIDFWGGGKSTAELLELNMKRVLHGEQEYEYIKDIKPGDMIAVKVILEKIYTKASMDFVVVKREYFNENGELVLISRSTVIERH